MLPARRGGKVAPLKHSRSTHRPPPTGWIGCACCRDRLDSIVAGIDDCIERGGHAQDPVLLNAGTVDIRGITSLGDVIVHCQDSEGIVDAQFNIHVDVAHERGLLDEVAE